MTPCERIRERLADVDGGLDDEQVVEHLASCDDCSELTDALIRIDENLDSLDPHDAPDHLVESTARAIAEAASSAQEPEVAEAESAPQPWRRPTLSRKRAWLVAAATVVISLTAFGGLWLAFESENERTVSRNFSGGADLGPIDVEHPELPSPEAALPPRPIGQRGREQATPAQDEEFRRELAEHEAETARWREAAKKPAPPPASQVPLATEVAAADKKEMEEKLAGISIDGSSGAESRYVVDGVDVTELATGESWDEALERSMDDDIGESSELAQYEVSVEADSPIVQLNRAAVSSKLRDELLQQVPSGRSHSQVVTFDPSKQANEALRSLGYLDGVPVGAKASVGERKRATQLGKDQVALGYGEAGVTANLRSAAEAIAGRSWSPDLITQEATGYWDNTYVPGDPSLRLLQSRLSKGPLPFVRDDGTPYELQAAVRQYRQPFDLPKDAALAVYMHTDKRYVSGPTRLLLQVGLQATHRKSGLRPSMNIGVVLDLSSTTSRDVGASMRAFVLALSRARQTGDRFSVTVAGAPGGLVVPPDEFRHGPLTLALADVFAQKSSEAPTWPLLTAIQKTMASVAVADDPTAPLGASAVLLVTPASFDADLLRQLESMAHRSAVGGIPMSVVGVGGDVVEEEIDRLVLAGQGNRRLLTAPCSTEEANQVVDRELHSVSRTVARAVRLRIRLAPGVRLIEMFGSRRLEEQRAERVREAERSVDRRLARNLGIEADRGEDEEGMQVVIPGYYAGDAHVFLLDVLTDRPGSVADVTVRYKDLVYLRNGVARANVSLGGVRAEPGPLEHNVLKNWVASRLSSAAQDAGRRLAEGDVDGAETVLQAQLKELRELRHEVPGWANDAELRGDAAVLEDYLEVLHSDAVRDYAKRKTLVDSLELAGQAKVQALY